MRDRAAYIRQLNLNNMMNGRVRQLVTVLSLLVILGVFWSLKLTGITMAGDAFCGHEEHVHSDACVTAELFCTQEEIPPHTHTEACLQTELGCGLEEFPGHTHDESCLERELICTLEEIPSHAHSEDCFGPQLKPDAEKTGGHTHDDGCTSLFRVCSLSEGEGHSHGENCYETVLLCTREEYEGHSHGSDCYDAEQAVLSCGLEEFSGHSHGDPCYKTEWTCGTEEFPGHTHDDSCITRELTCSDDSEDHDHSEACYTASETCGMEETKGHSHNDSCYSPVLACTEPELEGHSHDDSCLQPLLICTQDEDPGHTHGSRCYGSKLRCDIPEQPAHTHDDSCMQPILICETEESDGTYSEDCYETVLLCTEEEVEGHTHETDCYVLVADSYICGQEEIEGHTHSEECLVVCSGFGCGQTEAEGHIHTDECLTEETLLSCGLEATEGHLHTEEDCYMIRQDCLLEEHIHDPSCYCDLTADLETNADWEVDLPEPSEDSPPAQRVIEVALSQLGNAESQLNFQVDENDVRRGITRYGQWYGNPYGDWSAMFAAFCLHYAGLDDLPVNSGPESMRSLWEAEGLYGMAAYFDPQAGHLLFLDMNHDGAADSIAVISLVTEDLIYAIQGDLDGLVAETTYPIGAEEILGYGRISTVPTIPIQVSEGATLVAQTGEDKQTLFDEGAQLVIYLEYMGEYYALDGYCDYVPVVIDADGGMFVETEQPELLFWEAIPDGDGNYTVQNLATGMYLPEDGFPIATYAGRESESTGDLQYARAANYNIWLDGTHGGLSAFGGSPNTRYTVSGDSVFTLPTTWQSPTKYRYVVQGWYDVVNDKYYAPGTDVVITGSTVFYPDWVASTYDIGKYNAYVADTVSTNSFVTTRLFDYNYLFNVLSANASMTVSNSSHSETWSIVQNGKVDFEKRNSLNFIFLDYGSGGTLDYPDNRKNGVNAYPGDGIVTGGIYNDAIYEALFSTDDNIPGKYYLGTGDHLFQIMDDPSNPYYGYYYYDSARNAASYNQSDQRFYVYDYLEATSADLSAAKSDFLPLNSPYANTNGQSVATYNADDEHANMTNYAYDAKYDGSGNASNRVSTNYAFGMEIDIQFYLPNVPGSQNGDVNKDLYGNDMRFTFSGDDDLWVLVDGELALDIGGIHQAETGEINFSTGEVLVQGKRNDTLSAVVAALEPGEHTLTVMYLERGASHSNCAIYFNIAPRFSFSIQKEDVLTRDVLNGAEFSVYLDEACTKPAQLWPSKESHDRGDPSTNAFTVTNGTANMWGMGAGNTYYIKETAPPDVTKNETYPTFVNGIISVTIDKAGAASYSVDLLPEEGHISAGFTVHGFRIDDETQTAYIIATNAPDWADETTKVTAFKKWNDKLDHSGESVSVYLTVKDRSGTVTRLQEGILSSENDWLYTWENLPKYWPSNDWSEKTPIEYSVEEAYVSGYYSKVEGNQTSATVTTTSWTPSTKLENGKTYILGNSSGQYLASLAAGQDTGFQWVNQEFAQSLSLAQWTATVSSGKVRLTNGAGQTLTFYDTGSYVSDFYAYNEVVTSSSSAHKQQFTQETSGQSIRLYHKRNNSNTKYYLDDVMTDNGQQKFKYTTTQSSAMLLTPKVLATTSQTVQLEGLGFLVTNTPLEKETSLTVSKVWNYANANPSTDHEKEKVTLELLANGVPTGRTVTLTLKNGWTDTFRGLPYTDDEGNLIYYSVEERWESISWTPRYGVVTSSGGTTPTYSTTVTNVYLPGNAVMLPSTGYAGRMLYQLVGGSTMLLSGIGWLILRRRQEGGRN